jgi:putative membrane protein
MYIRKNFPLRGVLAFSWMHLLWLTVWGAIAVAIYHFTGWSWLKIPWLPISLIGTAVAFYLGFKNNSSYDRMWEARKIWGAIVNDSRSWGTMTINFVTNTFNELPVSEGELKRVHKRLVYRHIAWLYKLRQQLLIPTAWEHDQVKFVRHEAERRARRSHVGEFEKTTIRERLEDYLDRDELETILSAKNGATQLIHHQAKDLKKLREEGLIDDFRHMEMQQLLTNFYTHQGKAERIKKFPFPRQYGSISFYFIGIFIILMPFGMLAEFENILADENTYWLTILFTTLVGWVFIMMELVGDYSENPFSRQGNDIPMMSLSRTIEIDLRQMLEEEKLPEGIAPIEGVLM